MRTTGRRVTVLPDECLREGLAQATDKAIIETVLSDYGLARTAMSELNRSRDMVEPRQLIHYFMSVNYSRTFREIGNTFRKDHSTITYSRNCVEGFIDVDHQFRLKVIRIAQSIIKNNMREKCQIIGKVTGLRRSEVVEKFAIAQRHLEAMGYEVFNPTEMVPKDTPHADAMRICLRNLCDMQVAALLPCWTDSPGARAEFQAVIVLNIKIIKL